MSERSEQVVDQRVSAFGRMATLNSGCLSILVEIAENNYVDQGKCRPLKIRRRF